MPLVAPSPLTTMAWVRLQLWATWDVFHPSQPMPRGFPLRVFFHPQKGLKLCQLEPSHKADWPGQNLFWVTKNQWLYLSPLLLRMPLFIGSDFNTPTTIKIVVRLIHSQG